MQLETFILRSLFAACMLVCSLVLGAMIYAKPAQATATTQDQSTTSTLAAAPANCSLPPDGVICPRRLG